MSVALLFFVTHSTPLAAQLLGAIPALPPVVVTQTADGLTATIGDETLRVSVCNASVIHVIATPKPPGSIKDDHPWILDPKQSCPGAKFQFSQTDDAAVLTTATLKVEAFAEARELEIQQYRWRAAAARKRCGPAHL